jgi:hypothetical protein
MLLTLNTTGYTIPNMKFNYNFDNYIANKWNTSTKEVRGCMKPLTYNTEAFSM